MTDSGAAPIDLHGSGGIFVAETTDEPRIRDLAWSTQAHLAPTLARLSYSAADDRRLLLLYFFGYGDRGGGK